MSKVVTDRVAVGLLSVAAILLLWNLGNGLLWQDEAETAVLARHTLRFGYPRAFDGRNYVTEPVHGYGAGEAWIYAPWVPFYLLAVAFAVAGESTAAARFPFAMLGWVSVWLTWRLVCRLTPDRRIQRLTVALLVCSVPFLLHMRQCRYYSLTTALILGVCLTYLRLLKRPLVTTGLGLGVLFAMLFHTNFGLVLPVLGAVTIHHLLRGSRVTRRPLVCAAGLAAVLTIPWAVVFYRPGAFVGAPTLGRLMDHLEYYVRITNKYLVPLAAMAATWLLGAVFTKHRSTVPGRSIPPATVLSFLILVVGLGVAFLLIPDQRHMRYLIPVLPLLLIGEAWWLVACIRRWRSVGWVIALLALFTNVLQSPHVRIPLTDFVYELTHAYRGPMEGVVGYLRAHGRPDQVVKIPYDDRTLMFYTDLKIERPSQFLHETDPDWVVIRRDWIPSEFFDSPYFHRIHTTYERIELDAPDIQWQNREDPGSHHFRTVQDAPRIVIYRRREAI